MPQDFSKFSLELLHYISRDLSSTLDLHESIAKVLFLSTQNVGAERGSIVVMNEYQVPIEAAIVIEDKLIPHAVQEAKSILDKGLAGWVMRHRQTALIMDTSQDARWLSRPDDAADRTGAKSAICVPLMARDQLVGVLTIVHPVPDFFSEEHLSLLESIASQSGSAVYNALLYESLQMAHRRYRDLFEDNIDPIIITNWEGQILEANKRAIETIECVSSDFLQYTVFELHKPRYDLFGKDYEHIKAGETITYESELGSECGAMPVEVHVRQVQIDNEHYLQWILRDISERKSLDSLRQDLSAMIYHDMRSPLSNISTSLDLLRDYLSVDDDETLSAMYAVVVRSTDRMHRLVNSLLDINRLEAGQSIAHQETVQLDVLIQEAIEVVRPNMDNKQQTLQQELSDASVSLLVDGDMIKRVLINLIENASKYSPVRGKITLKARQEGENILFSVADSGPGIPPTAREEVFQKFSRLQNEEHFPKGIGLGLAFCRLAIEAHNGKIWVEGNGEVGSRFIFSLPLKP